MANFKRQKLMVPSNSMLCNKASQRMNLNVINNLEFDEEEKKKRDEHQRELIKHKLRLVKNQRHEK